MNWRALWLDSSSLKVKGEVSIGKIRNSCLNTKLMEEWVSVNCSVSIKLCYVNRDGVCWSFQILRLLGCSR